MSGLQEIVAWTAPPVIGAFIGYVTNDIAIRMLFRPLREARFLGVRLPFTPGIIPKERRTLSRSIARMVSRELLTEDALRRQLHGERAREQLARSIAGASTELLQTPISAFAARGLPALLPSLQEALGGLLAGLFRSPGFYAAVRSLAGRLVASVGAQNVGDLLDRHELPAWARRRLLPLLRTDQARGAAGREAARLFSGPAGADAASGETSGAASSATLRPADLVSAQLALLLKTEAARLIPSLLQELLGTLRTGEERKELERQGRILVRSIVEKLNVIQRLLVGAGQFDRRLEEKMPEIVADALDTAARWTEDPAHASRMADALLDGLLRKDAAAGRAGESAGVARIVEVFVRDLVGAMGESGALDRLLDRLVEALRGGGHRTVGALLSGGLGIRDVDAVEFLSFQVLNQLTRGETARDLAGELSTLAARFVEDNKEKNLAAILGIDEGRKRKLDAWLLGKLVEVLDQRLPEILGGIDVESLVIEKIDGLDVREVEKLIVAVIASHLKWINVFGAILGFLIGLLQIALRLVGLS